MADVWEGIDLHWKPLFGNWVLKRMEFCAEDNGVRVRFVTDRELVKELTMPEMLQAIGSDTRVIRHQISWDDWRRLVSRIDYQKYGCLDVSCLSLSVRAQNALRRAGINTISRLELTSDSDLRKLRNVGTQTIQEIRDQLIAFRKDYRV